MGGYDSTIDMVHSDLVASMQNARKGLTLEERREYIIRYWEDIEI